MRKAYVRLADLDAVRAACAARQEHERELRAVLRRGEAAVKWFARDRHELPMTFATADRAFRAPQDFAALLDLVRDAEIPGRFKLEAACLVVDAAATMFCEVTQRSNLDLLFGPLPLGQVGGRWRAGVHGRIRPRAFGRASRLSGDRGHPRGRTAIPS